MRSSPCSSRSSTWSARWSSARAFWWPSSPTCSPSCGCAHSPYEGVRLLLGRFLALGLEFQLASDILGTAVSPTYDQIGKLGAIAAIRTALNYFLSQELDRAREVVAEERAFSSDERGARPPARADPPTPRADG